MERYSNDKVDLRNSLIRIGDLINLDGPLLSLFIDTRNKDLYIFDWIEANDKTNRWLVYKVKAELLNLFLSKVISYKEMFNAAIKNSNYYYADIINLKESEYSLNKIAAIPKEYFPTEDVLFEKNDSKNYSQIITTIDKILNKDKVENTFNRIEFKEEYKKNKFWAFLRQPTIVRLSNLEESKNTLPNNAPMKLVPQHNVRENNRLLKEEGLDVYTR